MEDTESRMNRRLNIAIVGMGCFFPGAHSLDEYWRNILSGRTFFSEVPKDRWNFDRFWSPNQSLSNKTYSKLGAFIQDFKFPYSDYRLPPNLWKGCDITQLVTLEAAKQAIKDAGLAPRDERLTQAITVLGMSGVDEWVRLAVYPGRLDFLEDLVPKLLARGVDPSLVRELAEEIGRVVDEAGYHYEHTTAAVGAIPSSVSNRIAQVFGIRGFNMTVDAACASSVTAIQVACDALMAGDTRIAVTGGADMTINPPIYIGFARVGGLSQSGHSNPFDASADGLIIGEGVGVLVLKRLEDALEDGDRIHAVIQGIGSTSDGAGNAIYAPSAEGRAECMRLSLECAGRDPRDVQYIEAHATSTIVGDGNEYDAMGIAYGQHADPDRPIVLGSVKSQIGHLKAAAGAAGLIKTVLAMENHTLPHMPRFRNLTGEATYGGSGLRIPTEPSPWQPGRDGMRVAGVTASGFGGINYHVIIEQGDEYKAPPPREPIDRDMAIVGIACRTPGAADSDEFMGHLLRGDELFTPVDYAKLGWHAHRDVPKSERISVKRIGQLEDWEPDLVRYRIFPNARSQIAEAQLLGLELADELMESMGIDRLAPKRMAVSIGSMHHDHLSNIMMCMLDDVYREATRSCASFQKMPEQLREEALEDAVKSFTGRFPPSTEHTLPGWMTNCLSGRIANVFNLQGPNFIVDTACSSGVAAFLPAVYELAFGRSPIAIAGGLNRSHNDITAIGVTSLGAVSEDVARPFDVKGHGFLMSEGGVLYLLKRLADARRDGNTVLGVVKGISGSSEADSKTMVAPTPAAIERAMHKAVEQAGVDRDEIGVVDVHGSANYVSDVSEIQALAGELRPASNGRTLLVTAAKSHVGHMWGGSGATSTLSVIGSLNGKRVPGIRNLTEPLAECIELEDRVRPVQQTTDLPAWARWGAVQSIGLGGANYAMIVGPGDLRTTIPPRPPVPSDREGASAAARPRPASAPSAGAAPAAISDTAPTTASPQVVDRKSTPPAGSFPDLLTVESPDMEGIRRLVVQAAKKPEPDSVISDVLDGGLRLSLTYSSQEDLEKKVEAFVKVLDGHLDPRPLEGLGVHTSWSGPEPMDAAMPARLAFCFPGQGTQYLGMGQCLYDRYPIFRRTMEEVDGLARQRFGYRLIEHLYSDPDDSDARKHMGTLVGVQTSVFAVELAIARLLESMGVTPSVLLGQSFGEFIALTFARVWDLPTGYAAVAARIEAAEISRSFGDLGMMSLICDEEKRRAILASAGSEVELTNINSPTQSILSGPRKALESAQAFAEGIGADAKILPIASAFHSSYMEPAREPFRRALEVLPCGKPGVPILSTINGRHYPSTGITPAMLAEHLSRQLVTPIDLPRNLRTLYSNGVRHFLEVGPNWSLTRMISASFEDLPYRSAPTIQPKVGDGEMFERARAFLIALGHLDPYVGYTSPSARPYTSVIPAAVRVSTSPRESAAGRPGVGRTSPAIKMPRLEDVPQAPAPSSPGRDMSREHFAGLMRARLAERTGYPEDLIKDNVDLESDLGIDSVLRAEIWNEILESHGLDPKTKPSKVRSIGELAGVLAQACTGIAPAAPQVRKPSMAASQNPPPAGLEGESARLASVMRAKLAERTGYPEDLLMDEVDLEGDLGIDSVLRAEIWNDILAAEGLDPKTRPSKVRSIGELSRVLAQAKAGILQPSAPPPQPRPLRLPAPQAASVRVAAPAGMSVQVLTGADLGTEVMRFASLMRSRLAERTGYPVDLLTDEIDLEGDLGIDSVLRAEIWNDILTLEGLDPKTRPSKVRSIGELSKVLAEAKAGSLPPPLPGAGHMPAAEPLHPAGDLEAEASRFASLMRAKLAERTGYPADLLSDEVDLEGDLGIDSVLRAEIWNDILAAEGLDPKTRPSKVRSIGELSRVLARARVAAAPPPVTLPPSPPAEGAQPALDAHVDQAPCILHTAAVVPIKHTEIRPFTCRRILLITGHPKTDDDVRRMIEARGIEVESMDAEVIAGDGKSIGTLVDRCDTIIYSAHAGLAVSSSKAGRLAAALREEALKLFDVFRALKRHLAENPRRVLVPISMDGCFGAIDGSGSLLGSFPAGFVLSLQRELPTSSFQLLDGGAMGWTDAISKHIDISSERIMVGWRGKERVTTAQIPMAHEERSSPAIGKGDLVLVTGGARGIVYECVRSLALETGCRLVLTGRTPPAEGGPDWLEAPPESIDGLLHAREVELARARKMSLGDARQEGRRMRAQWELNANLRRLASEGVTASYETCDVSSVESLRTLVRRLRKRGEVVAGVVHGAGTQRAAHIEDLANDQVLGTVMTKIMPLVLLAEALDWGKVRMFVSFGSVTGAFGNEGQTDYGLANFLLTGACRSLARQHPSAGVQSIEWTAWGGVGMVTGREIENFKKLGLTVLDTASGSRLFLDAVLGHGSSAQISVFNPGSAFSLAPGGATRPRLALLKKGSLTARFSPEKDAFLGQHLLNGQPVVPGTFVIEMFAEAIASGHPASLGDVNFRRPMWIRRENHGVEIVMDGKSLRALPEQRPDVPARALSNLQYSSAHMSDPAPLVDPVESATAEEMAILFEKAKNGAARAFYGLLDENFRDSLATGPIFRGLRATMYEGERCVGLIELTPEAREQFDGGSGFLFNPVASDMAVQVASSWAMDLHGVMAIPASVERVEIHAPLESTEAVVCCRLVSMNEDRTIVDLTVRSPDGRPLYDMRKLVLRSIARIAR